MKNLRCPELAIFFLNVIQLQIDSFKSLRDRYLQNSTANNSEYTLFSRACETFSRIDYMLCHKTRLNKFKRMEMIQMCSDHNGMKLDISNRGKLGNSQICGN